MIRRNPDPLGADDRQAGRFDPNDKFGRVLPADTPLTIARRLWEYLDNGHQASDRLAETSDQICDKLRLSLVDILGTSGYRFLLVRAVAAAGAASELAVGDNDRLKDASGSALGPSHLAALEATLASVFTLMGHFVGENLLLRFIHQAWPDFVVLPPFTRKQDETP